MSEGENWATKEFIRERVGGNSDLFNQHTEFSNINLTNHAYFPVIWSNIYIYFRGNTVRLGGVLSAYK